MTRLTVFAVFFSIIACRGLVSEDISELGISGGGLEMIRGVVWEDKNSNGVRDQTERNVEGVQVFVLDEHRVRINSTKTTSSGYEMAPEAHVTSPVFYIEVIAPEDHVFTQEDVGPDSTDSDVGQDDGISLVFDLIDINDYDLTIDAGVYLVVEEPMPTITPALTETPTPAPFMPSHDIHELSASFSNGTLGCGMVSSFTVPFVAVIDGDKLTLDFAFEGITYTGTINPDGTFLVMDDSEREMYEGKFNQDWSGEAINSLTEDGCTTTWDIVFTPSEE